MAQQAFAEAIQVATELVENYGETVSALEVLAHGEMHLGLTLTQQDMADQASAHLSRARFLYQRLVLVFPHEERYKSALKALEAAESGV